MGTTQELTMERGWQLVERGEHTQLIKLLVYFERLYVFLKNTCFKTNNSNPCGNYHEHRQGLYAEEPHNLKQVLSREVELD